MGSKTGFVKIVEQLVQCIISQFANRNASILIRTQRVDKLNELVLTQTQLIHKCIEDISNLHQYSADLRKRIIMLENITTSSK